MNITENIDLKSQLLADFEAQAENSNSSISAIQKEAFEAFATLGFPTTKHEEWKYSNVKKLTNQSFDFHAVSNFSAENLQSIALPHLEGNVLYFINGVYNATLSNIVSGSDKIKIMPLSEAIHALPEIMEKHFAQYANYKNEHFTALNTAFAHDGVVVYVPNNVIVEEPIIVRMIADVRNQQVGSQIRNLIVVGKNAEVKIAEAYRTFGEESSFVNTVTEIVLGEEARVDYYKVQNDNDASFHIGTTQVYQENKSYFYAATVTLNGGFVRNNLNLSLDGEHIESHMFGLYVPNGKQHVDNHTLADHRKPNSVSNELYKGVLMDSSTGVFNGKIYVQPDAQKTNAYQNCRNVITSDSASMNSKPQLEIWADDVKCSHGTTTGKLNDEAIFYMQSRGISKPEAIKLQLLAFAEDVISQIKIDSIREYLEEKIAEKLA